MRPVILAVAPVAAGERKNDPAAIADDVYAAYERGASMVHLHSRDAQGNLTADTAWLGRTVGLIRERCPIVIEISTGGVSDLTIEQRCETCKPDWVEVNSLNVGSVNLGESVYKNPIADVRYCVKQILQNRKSPEIEVFEPGMIYTARQLADRYDLPRPVLFAIVLGHAGAMPADPFSLSLMLSAYRNWFHAPDEALWGITEYARSDWRLIGEALDLGASAVRVGFEDSDFLSGGIRAKDNAEIVGAAAETFARHGVRPATADETREMLRLPALRREGFTC